MSGNAIYQELTASDEPPIHELQHLHRNCFLVKILAFEPTANRNFFCNTGDALIFESDKVISLPPDLCRTTSPVLKSVFIESLWEGWRSTLARVPSQEQAHKAYRMGSYAGQLGIGHGAK